MVREETFGGRVWIVGHHRRIPDEPRHARAPGFVEEVSDGLERLASDAQSLVSMTANASLLAACHSVGESAMAEVSLPPFPRLEGPIPGGGQKTRQGGTAVHAFVQAGATHPEFFRLILLRPGA